MYRNNAIRYALLMKKDIASATAPTSGDEKTKQQQEALEGLGISSVDFYVNDYREVGDSPHSLGKVEIEAIFGVGEKQASVFFQNEGDGKLNIGSVDKEATEDSLVALGRYPSEDKSAREQLTELLAPTGILEKAQEEFDSYLASCEPEVTKELYRPEAAYGGYEYRAYATKDDLVSIQSRTPEGDTFRSHGTISKECWDGLGIADKGNPALISGICTRLDNGEELHKLERSNEPER